MTGLTYRPEIDGLRSIAVYLVLFFHAGMVTFEGGFIGVDLFFVLSGFLVSAVILSEVDRLGTFDLGNFYSRRVRRLLPAAVVVIVATALVQVLVAALPTRLDFVDDARASLLYFANWHFITEARDYFADGNDSPYLHFWSLAIEEQFYIVFPLLVLGALRFGRRPIRALALMVATVAVASIVLQVWRAAGDPTYAYYATETRVYQLAVGVLLTLGFRAMARRDVTSLMRRAAPSVAVLGLLALVVTATRWADVSPSVRGLLATVASAALIAGVWWAPTSRLSRLLGSTAPSYLGKISYGTYLWHWPVLLVLLEVFDVRPLVMALLGSAVASGLAALSFTLFEHPLRRAPVLAGRRWSVVAVGVATSIVVAVALTPPILESDRRVALTADSGREAGSLAADLDRPVPRDLDLVAASKDLGPTTSRCTPDELDACTLVDGGGTHVLLLGDSQARTYVPALEAIAREQSLTFSTNVIAGCPWQAGQVNMRTHEERRSECQEGRGEFFDEVLPEMDVDVVVAVGLSRSDEFWAEHLTGQTGQDESLGELQVRTTRETAEAITAAGSELVIAHSVIGTEGFGVDGFDPIDCLARAQALVDCAVTPPLDRPTVDGAYTVLDTGSADIHTVDFNPVICPAQPVCSPVLDGTVVWRDTDHVTSEVLHQQRSGLWRRLQETGAFQQD